MFDVLMGSTRRRERKAGRGVVSAVLHFVVIAGVAKATTNPAPAALSEPRVVDVILDASREPAPRRMEQTTATSEIAAAPIVNPVVVVPTEVPVGVPPVTLNERWSPRDIVLSSGPAGIPGAPIGAVGFDPDSILAEAAADEPATVLLQRPPRYPPSLQAAGLEGRVAIRFVIDMRGRAEPASIRITSATHSGFEESARETILKTVFNPARVRGRAVRQWAEQSVVFRITP